MSHRRLRLLRIVSKDGPFASWIGCALMITAVVVFFLISFIALHIAQRREKAFVPARPMSAGTSGPITPRPSAT